MKTLHAIEAENTDLLDSLRWRFPGITDWFVNEAGMIHYHIAPFPNSHMYLPADNSTVRYDLQRWIDLGRPRP